MEWYFQNQIILGMMECQPTQGLEFKPDYSKIEKEKYKASHSLYFV
jgi:hypothetical protein